MVENEARFRWNRYRDSVIITALGAAVDEGNRSTSTGAWSFNSTSFPTGQVLNSDGEDAMSRALLEDVITKFEDNDVDIEGPERPVLLLGPNQKQALRDEDVLVNFDYQSSKPLSGPGLPTALGFDVIVSTQLATTTNAAGDTVRYCYAFLPSGIMFAEWEDMEIQIDNRPDRRNATQIAFDHESGAIRLDDYKVVKIPCAERTGI
jgi:hypothetical protein